MKTLADLYRTGEIMTVRHTEHSSCEFEQAGWNVRMLRGPDLGGKINGMECFNMSEPDKDGTMAGLFAAPPLDWCAVQFARWHHRHQSRRQGTPYTSHLGEVAGLVAHLGAKAVGAAWLHDVSEDQTVTVNELAMRFGADAAYAVNILTVTALDGDRQQQLQRSIEKLRTAEDWVKAIKLADIVSNLTWLDKAFHPDFCKRYRAEKAQQVAVLYAGKSNQYLYDTAKELTREPSRTG